MIKKLWILFLIFWVAFFLGGMLTFLPSLKGFIWGYKTKGVVIEVEKYVNEDGTTMYKPTLNYLCGWRDPITSKKAIASNKFYYKGQKLSIVCNPQSPTDFWELSFTEFFPLFFVLIGVWGLLFCIKVLKNKRLAKRLKAWGLLKEILLTWIEDSWWKVNGISGYRLLFSDSEEQYRTAIICESALPSLFKIGDKFPMYIDPNDPTKYWIDYETIIAEKKTKGSPKTKVLL